MSVKTQRKTQQMSEKTQRNLQLLGKFRVGRTENYVK